MRQVLTVGKLQPQKVVHVKFIFISFQKLALKYSSQAVTHWRQMKTICHWTHRSFPCLQNFPLF